MRYQMAIYVAKDETVTIDTFITNKKAVTDAELGEAR